MKSLFIVFLVMLTGSTQAFELSSDARAWIEPIHPVTKDLKQAGISFCKLSYNYVSGEYNLDLQLNPITNLTTIAQILKRHNFANRPLLPFGQHIQQALPETMPSTFPGEPLR